MNRAVNEGLEVNKQKHTLPLLGLVNDYFEKDNYLVKLIADELSVDYRDILGFELSLYEYEKGCLVRGVYLHSRELSQHISFPF